MFCGRCGRPRAEGDAFCPGCGARYPDAPRDATAPDEDEQTAGYEEPTIAADPAPDDPPYGSEMALAAGLLSFFMPFIALIVALVMRAGELRPRRRGFLKTWAIASGAWLCTGWLIFVLVVTSSGALGGGGCQGGPDPFGLPSYTSSDGKHWTAHIPCVNGGSTSRPARPSEVPGQQP
jgi:hypothetical protein